MGSVTTGSLLHFAAPNLPTRHRRGAQSSPGTPLSNSKCTVTPPPVGHSADRNHKEPLTAVRCDQRPRVMVPELRHWNYAGEHMYATLRGAPLLHQDLHAPHHTTHRSHFQIFKLPQNPQIARVWPRRLQQRIVFARANRYDAAPRIKNSCGQCQCVTRNVHRQNGRGQQRAQQRQR